MKNFKLFVAFISLSSLSFSASLGFSDPDKLHKGLLPEIARKFNGYSDGVLNPETDTENNCHIEIFSNFDDHIVVKVFNHKDRTEQRLKVERGEATLQASKKRIKIENDSHVAVISLDGDQIEKVSVARSTFGFEFGEHVCYSELVGDGAIKTKGLVDSSRSTGKEAEGRSVGSQTSRKGSETQSN
ncbi:MAG: hypothetical protein KC478_05975 [Bacteriovoracaceae bacterium]|nr:hypothetical protein [Bacteriovoracaceae bacterium]